MTELVRTYKLTVDSTPGSESVEFAGLVTVNLGEQTTKIDLGGSLAVSLKADTDQKTTVRSDNVEINSPTGGYASLSNGEDASSLYLSATPGQEDPLIELGDENQDDVFTVSPSGAVTISPSDGSQNDQFLFDSPTTIAEAATLFSFRSAEAGEYLGADGDGTLRLGNGLILANTVSDEMAFFHGTLTSKPTGVAVNDAAIHAALVTLNLIEA